MTSPINTNTIVDARSALAKLELCAPKGVFTDQYNIGYADGYKDAQNILERFLKEQSK